MANPMWEQFERDLAERKAMDAAWTQFLDVLTGRGLEVPDEMLDEEEEVEREEEERSLRDSIMRNFTGGKPAA